jgi:DNA invertase Pin-like site-specific DNA recombinase
MGKQENKMAVGYLRVSSKGQIKGHGFERQRDEIKRHA